MFQSSLRKPLLKSTSVALLCSPSVFLSSEISLGNQHARNWMMQCFVKVPFTRCNCEYSNHSVHKLIQWYLISNLIIPQKSVCSPMWTMVPSDCYFVNRPLYWTSLTARVIACFWFSMVSIEDKIKIKSFQCYFLRQVGLPYYDRLFRFIFLVGKDENMTCERKIMIKINLSILDNVILV